VNKFINKNTTTFNHFYTNVRVDLKIISKIF